MQNLYDVKNKRFNSEGLTQILDSLSKKHYNLQIVEFVKFLKDKVLVEAEQNRINPKKIQKKIQENKLLTRILFEGKITSDSENDQEEEFDETVNQPEMSPNTYRYYNPFDFISEGSQNNSQIKFEGE